MRISDWSSDVALPISDRSIVEATVRAHGDHELLTEVCSLLRAEQSFHEQQARRIEQEEKVAEFVETNRLLAVAESALKEQVGALVMELRETQIALERQFLGAKKIQDELDKERLRLNKALAAEDALDVERAQALAVEKSLRVSVEQERNMRLPRMES